MRRTILALAAAVTLAGCAQPTPEQQVVNDTVDALGGRDRIQSIKTLTLVGEGTNGNLGQDMSPSATGQSFTVSDYKRVLDVAGARMRIEQTRTPNFAYFQGPQPQKQVLGIDGDVAYNVAANGNATRASATVAADRRADFYHHPVTIVRAVLDPATRVENSRTEGNERLVDVTLSSGQRFTLAIDNTSHRPTRVSSQTYNPNLGDLQMTTRFADYQDVSGLQLPARLTLLADDFTMSDLRLKQQTVDGDAGDLAAPAAAASAVPAVGPPPVNVAVVEAARGVWYLAGQSHHSVLVEFSDHLTLIEVPQSEARTLGVIAKARELRPNKPLTQAVVTHHHFDHTGGIRAAVSEGLSLVVSKVGAEFYEEALKRPHTITPDALARNPKPPKLETVDQELALKDDTMTVMLYPVTGNPHGDTLLMAHFPRERLLVEADLYNPGATVTPYAANLLENVTKRSLRVDRVLPIHGTIFPFIELVKVVKATPTQTN